jgi:hypothetical protein
MNNQMNGVRPDDLPDGLKPVNTRFFRLEKLPEAIALAVLKNNAMNLQVEVRR